MAKKQTYAPKKVPYTMNNFLVSCYLILMFTFFELFLTAQFARARTDKFILFMILTGFLVFLVSIVTIATYADKKSKPQTHLQQSTSFSPLSVTDIAFIAFFIFAAISTLLSEYKLHSLLGNDATFASSGRDNGLLLLTAYVLMYFIVSRFYFYKEYVLAAFMVFGCIISGLAILNFFYIDPIGLYDGYSQSVIDDFCSTIGNKNLTSSYMCIFMPVAMMMFVVFKKMYMQVLCGVALAFAYCGLLVAGSNSGYIGFFVMLVVMLAICIRYLHMLKRFIFALSIMFASGLILRLFSLVMNDKCKGFEAIGQKLVYSNYVFIIIAVTGLLTVGLYALDKFTNASQHWPKNTLMTIVIAISVCAVLYVLYLMYYYTFVDTTTDLGSLNRLLRFDERWGTHRGYYWIHGMEMFGDFGIADKLFGTGCDTFYYVLKPLFPELIVKFNESSTNCAHNEYINYLVTQGVLGLASYLTIIISTIVRAFKTSKTNVYVLVYLLPVITYCAQAVVNIYQPITTPFLFIFIALCEATSRNRQANIT